MGFASTYLEQRALFPEIIKEAPDEHTGIIVVVPAYDEPGITMLLDSLADCDKPECNTEIIIVVNAPENASEESIENNRITIENIESWKKKNQKCFFRLFYFTAEPCVSSWGVGLARKTGMDEAVRRFNKIENPAGVILSLDADCKVGKNYFVSVCNELLMRRDRSACSIYFEHPLSGYSQHEELSKYITLYELHLRYYLQSVAWAGFPYVFHTVGSAFAVKALPYIKAGGMNRKQAGEDFYFIQKLVPEGGYFNLNSTTVFPSPRVSFRVPFGTGAAIGKLNDGNLPTLLTYNILAFKELRTFFSMAESFFLCHPDNLHDYYRELPEGLRLFVTESDLREKILEIKKNTSGLTSFKKRFFGWFNMFRIVKYLNCVHSGCFEKKPVEISANELLEMRGIGAGSEEPFDLLLDYRKMERNS
jgi:hypothetical protein